MCITDEYQQAQHANDFWDFILKHGHKKFSLSTGERIPEGAKTNSLFLQYAEIYEDYMQAKSTGNYDLLCEHGRGQYSLKNGVKLNPKICQILAHAFERVDATRNYDVQRHSGSSKSNPIFESKIKECQNENDFIEAILSFDETKIGNTKKETVIQCFKNIISNPSAARRFSAYSLSFSPEYDLPNVYGIRDKASELIRERCIRVEIEMSSIDDLANLIRAYGPENVAGIQKNFLAATLDSVLYNIESDPKIAADIALLRMSLDHIPVDYRLRERIIEKAKEKHEQNILESISADAPIMLEDIVVSVRNPNSKGEYGATDSKSSEAVLPRLIDCITSLVKIASDVHKRTHFTQDQMIKGHENCITRLVTSEFCFYTKTPLSMSEFNQFRAELFAIASEQPENLHLILSSFAIKTTDGKSILNVSVHIQCSKTPIIDYIVKNTTSSTDPVYKEVNVEGVSIMVLNIVQNLIDNTKNLISLNEKMNPFCSTDLSDLFSFNNIIVCTTAGGEQFFCCVDICNDHVATIEGMPFSGASKGRLYYKLLFPNPNEYLPNKCSQVLCSNWISMHPESALKTLTHADPYCSRASYGVVPLTCKYNFNSSFHVFMLPARPCDYLPSAFKLLADKHNTSIRKREKQSDANLSDDQGSILREHSSWLPQLESGSLPVPGELDGNVRILERLKIQS